MYRPRSPVIFRYLTIADLRANGIPATELDDATALTAIEAVSHRINDLTDQWFSPIYVEDAIDGKWHRRLALPNLINILEVTELQFKSGGAENYQLDTLLKDDYDQLERWLDRKPGLGGDGRRVFPNIRNSTTTFNGVTGDARTRDPRWTEASAPYIMKGYFGNVKCTKGFGFLPVKFETELATAPLAVGDTTMEVADATDIQVGDALLIDRRTSVIVTNVTPTVSPAATIEFDPVRRGAAVGAEVVTFGPVHEGIKRATLLLVNDPVIKNGLNSSGGSSASASGRLIFEKTDNYSYRLSDEGNTANAGGGGRPTSGNLEVDNILNDFLAPPYVGVV